MRKLLWLLVALLVPIGAYAQTTETVYAVAVDDSALTLYTVTAADVEPVWAFPAQFGNYNSDKPWRVFFPEAIYPSPDGRHVAFIALDANDTMAAFVYHLGTNQGTQLEMPRMNYVNTYPMKWSSDGSKLGYVGLIVDGPYADRLSVYDTRNGNADFVTNLSSIYTPFTWLDDNTIAFGSNPNAIEPNGCPDPFSPSCSIEDVYIIDLDTGEPNRLTQVEGLPNDQGKLCDFLAVSNRLYFGDGCTFSPLASSLLSVDDSGELQNELYGYEFDISVDDNRITSIHPSGTPNVVYVIVASVKRDDEDNLLETWSLVRVDDGQTDILYQQETTQTPSRFPVDMASRGWGVATIAPNRHHMVLWRKTSFNDGSGTTLLTIVDLQTETVIYDQAFTGRDNIGGLRWVDDTHVAYSVRASYHDEPLRRELYSLNIETGKTTHLTADSNLPFYLIPGPGIREIISIGNTYW